MARGVPMLRIHFTDADLGRTTVAGAPDPLWETLLSGFRLRERDRSLAFHPWVGRLRSDPERSARMRTGTRVLATLAPRGPYFPDFLTPVEALDGLDAGLDALLRTPRELLREQLHRLDRSAPLPEWVRPLVDGERDALGRLAGALRNYYDAGIAPYEDLIQGAVDFDRARRAHHFLDGGVDRLLNGIGPVMRWRPPVLEVAYAVDQELHLRGRGLRLVPSYFCGETACGPADPDLPPVLIYPIDPESRWAHAGANPDHRPLEALIGTTRAAILHAVNLGATTTELAHRAGTSLPSVSRHTATLRDAGLISTVRDGSAVVHMLTPLGAAMLGHHRQRRR
jgi:DNA-binding transcriptional ArsR family regulator